MKLSDFFPTPNRMREPVNRQESTGTESASAARINRQIKSLVPGKLLQGEVVEKNGVEVRIKLSEDLVMTARLDQEVNVEEGKLLTFQVKNNGASLVLNPLFTNTAASDNVLKALQMANLPVTDATISMTEQMMQQGMSVDARSLQQVFRDVAAHSDAPVQDIVLLHELSLPVDETNLQQIASYRELTHQLIRGMADVVEGLAEAYAEVSAEQGKAAADGMLRQITGLFLSGQEGEAGAAETETGIPDGQVLTQTEETVQADGSVRTERAVPPEETALTAGQENRMEGMPENTENLNQTAFPKTGEDIPIGKDGLSPVQTGQEGIGEQETEPAKQPSEKTVYRAEEVIPEKQTAAEAPAESAIQQTAEHGKEWDTVQRLFAKKIFHNWCIEPEEGVSAEKVDRLYRQIKEQLTGLQEILQEYGADKGNAMKSVLHMSRNLDFMEQLNQMYTYVQLPLKLEQRQANGELYVFSNKRSLAKKDGAVSALLHLDMEQLGPVDVYVAMQENRVTTRFQVQDEEMLLFLNEHMHILTKRLAQKGYDLKCEMAVRNGEGGANPVEQLLQKDKSAGVMMQYGFDVRA